MSLQPYWTSRDGRHCLYLGDCLEVLPGLAPHEAKETEGERA